MLGRGGGADTEEGVVEEGGSRFRVDREFWRESDQVPAKAGRGGLTGGQGLGEKVVCEL